jgi:hypothetical protein
MMDDTFTIIVSIIYIAIIGLAYYPTWIEAFRKDKNDENKI